ncbi:Cysteine-rich protein 2-binding protein [Pseudolycoriella hygida]|uniref:Cysteine-rich protein 2-binding protein n=1 Tax=Pseudolycoriella hygida TaxID=35572 RepID=A0A9Q0MMR3_9DIPT|nr:Cysteine-rich protein 2-binding protein [Pseudolycoriella hygida]
MDIEKNCKHCRSVINTDDYLSCEVCKFSIHIICLKNFGTPGDILGDVFFKFVCADCSSNSIECFERIHLPWPMLIVLAIYNLSIRSEGLGRQGFFHWRNHIASFIEKNWRALMGSIKQRKKWTGTISGSLSNNAPILFTSGYETFQDSGWWKLTYKRSPRQYMEFYQKLRTARKTVKRVDVVAPSTSKDAMDEFVYRAKRPRHDEVFSRSLQFMGRPPWKKPMTPEEPNEPSFGLLSDDSSNQELCLFDIPDFNLDHNSVVSVPTTTVNEWADNFMDVDYPLSTKDDFVDDSELRPRIVQVTNFQEADVHDPKFDCSYVSEHIKKEIDSDNSESTHKTVSEQVKTEIDSDNSESAQKTVCVESLFTKSMKRQLPWEVVGTNEEEYIGEDLGEDTLISEYEENEILKNLNVIMENDPKEIPVWIRQFYRKLCVREQKRWLMKPIFDIDNLNSGNTNAKAHILDRYHMLSGSSGRGKTFYSTLAGSMVTEMFESPYTGRLLHPYIHRNSKLMPKWVKLMCEIQYAVHKRPPSRASIDFCYVRPHHIAAVNSLLQFHFWPGIDMSECLSYPDFSVVALYKKLVVGCAFLVPDAQHCVAYVSFMAVRPGWQRAGIASFMLYHLAQTCMGKDITLHVSASNQAICFYQRFGFKVEEVLLDFYEKYLPKDSKQSRNALFLRLKR